MRPSVIVDTGPIVALLDADEAHHRWATRQFESLAPPLLTSESVLSEACFLMRRIGLDSSLPAALVGRGVLKVVDVLGSADEADAVASLIRRYANVPMSLADASLVRIAERTENGSVMTLNSDFSVYRRERRRIIPVLSPVSPAAGDVD